MIKATAIAITAAGAAVALSGCDISSIPLDGVVSTEVRTVAGFDSVELRGAADVVIIVGGSSQVEVTADTAVLRRLTTFIEDGELVIDTDESWGWGDTDVDVAISVPDLNGFDLKGAGNVVIRGISGELFEFSLDGAGDVSLTGSADTVNITLSGAGDLDASQLIGDDVTARLAGAGEITVNATDTLDVRIDGVGVINYLGSPQVTKKVDGVGSINRV